ncbi:hypothetical protein [Spirosoma radiotolerans]|uniref:Uncharacterized protein n=1 Tax=Spirosoma radiotolerans TaxID=1379870 RepID=A0A0E3ZVG0_9BACT|nr:hypothetical protein [Spirosoma radiotolerans]AKD55778.1 hypothetical protein SD10_13570 [Spirosoma radiotolerans]
MPHFLQAGPIGAQYENGFLRYLNQGDAEIIRMIYFAIRDHNWLTAALTITNEVIDKHADAFRIQYDWHTSDPVIQIAGHVDILGDQHGVITVDFYGKALVTFQRNRIGLCVLHPIEGVLGQPAELTAPDGTVTDAHFPTTISPHQPFLNLRTMRWQPASGTVWQLDFSGDVFETEDQRNWTDASFKTYSTPLTRPFPVTVQAGDEVRQRVVFRPSAQALSNQPTALLPKNPVQSVAAPKPDRLRLGVGQWAGGPPLTPTEAALLRRLGLSHLRADVFFRLPHWEAILTNAVADAQQLDIPLELTVFFGNDPLTELRQLLNFLQRQAVSVRSMLLLDAATLTTSDRLLQTVVPVLRAEWPNLLIGGGTDDNFAELNRHRFDFSLVDFVFYSINPQVHAYDDLTLEENIAGQPETVFSARLFSGGKPIHISPITLLPRYTTVAETALERLNAPADGRQTTHFGAEWTRQSLRALAKAGVASVTYYQSHGPGGLVNGDTVYPLFSAFTEF